MRNRNWIGWFIYAVMWTILSYFGLHYYHIINYNLFLLCLIALCLGATVLLWGVFGREN